MTIALRFVVLGVPNLVTGTEARHVPALHTDAGLALDEEKNIYVSDPQLSGIEVYAYDGRFLYRFGSNGTKAGEFDAPEGLWMESGKTL